jgi:hypothetical protein
MWKLRYRKSDPQPLVVGYDLRDWRRAPVRGIQTLAVKLSKEDDGKSRVVWYHTVHDHRVYHEVNFYAWFECDNRPSGVTPDAVLDRWAEKTGDTSVKVGDLSLDDLHSIDVKIGASVSNEEFADILAETINDLEIP